MQERGRLRDGIKENLHTKRNSKMRSMQSLTAGRSHELKKLGELNETVFIGQQSSEPMSVVAARVQFASFSFLIFFDSYTDPVLQFSGPSFAPYTWATNKFQVAIKT